jgi:hypothetical protein
MLADTPRAATAQAAAAAAAAAVAAEAEPAVIPSVDPYGWRREAGLPPVGAAATQAAPASKLEEAPCSREAVKERSATSAAVCSAAYFGAVDGLEAAFARGGSVASRDETGMTPLHWAAHGGHAKAAQLLLRKGSDLSATNRDGWTPLHFAACAGHVETVKALLRAGADADVPNEAGRTPFQVRDPAPSARSRTHPDAPPADG